MSAGKFRAPAESLGTINSQTIASLLGAAADIALVLDKRGVIRDISVSSSELDSRNLQVWIGRKWLDTVKPDSVDKVLYLLSDEEGISSNQRQINHVTPEGENLLILYSAVPLEENGYRVAVGKDLSSLTRMQQRLVNVQQSMERDYSQLRQFEARYRLLFKTARDAIVITEAETFKVMEVNPSACELLGTAERKLVGGNLMRWFDPESRQLIEDALATVRISGKISSISLRLKDSSEFINANLALFKTGNQTHVLVRLERQASESSALSEPEQSARLMSLVENAPDALVVTDMKGKILTVNTEFLDLSQLASADLASEQLLSNWLGQGGIDFQIIMSSLREHGSIRLYNTQMRGEFGSVCDVEVSASSVSDNGLDCIGFSIRNVSRRIAANDDSSGGMTPKSINQLTQLVGRVPLKDLVRESTELIEQLCIQSALKLTNNNRASAAEILGLSRQSLYVKLRRYSLDDENSPAA